MGLLDAVAHEPSAQDGAKQIRQAFHNSFRQLEMSLKHIQTLVARHGQAEIEKALEGDAKQLSKMYAALKTFVETHKPDAQVPELPQASARKK